MSTVKQLWKALFPSNPVFTESDVTSQHGKVFMITGGNGGLGRVLAAMLYATNAKVYIAARSETKAQTAIDEVKKLHPDSSGELAYLKLDLNDLTTIKRSANEFLAKESRLDILWNNAGVMVPPQGSKTAQGYELQLGTNNIGPFLFTRLLQPALVAAARTGSARVVWVSSSAANIAAPKPAFDFDNMDYKRDEAAFVKYARSKAGKIIHAVQFARRSDKAGTGIIHTSVHPGFLETDIHRSTPWYQMFILNFILAEPRFGALTLLFAGLHPSIAKENNGAFVAPFGRLDDAREDLLDETLGRKFWQWSEEQVRPYL